MVTTNYEISNYAKPGFESRHNLGYWSHIPYLGVGLMPLRIWMRNVLRIPPI